MCAGPDCQRAYKQYGMPAPSSTPLTILLPCSATRKELRSGSKQLAKRLDRLAAIERQQGSEIGAARESASTEIARLQRVAEVGE